MRGKGIKTRSILPQPLHGCGIVSIPVRGKGIKTLFKEPAQFYIIKVSIPVRGKGIKTIIRIAAKAMKSPSFHPREG